MFSFLDYVLHLTKYLPELVNQYGYWIYAILFLVIFCETGLVVTPFLPGDSLLFIAGSLSALGKINVHGLVGLLFISAVLGDMVNFYVGLHWGRRLFKNPNSRLFKRQYLEKTEAFYAKHGGKTIVLARFIPIIRTFMPFVAGMGRMPYRYFVVFNVFGALLWVALFVYGGYFFGNLKVVQNNLSLVMMGIIVVSILPMVIEAIRYYLNRSL